MAVDFCVNRVSDQLHARSAGNRSPMTSHLNFVLSLDPVSELPKKRIIQWPNF
jgi:hypothetical protein